jgi:hypothetical protein
VRLRLLALPYDHPSPWYSTFNSTQQKVYRRPGAAASTAWPTALSPADHVS